MNLCSTPLTRASGAGQSPTEKRADQQRNRPTRTDTPTKGETVSTRKYATTTLAALALLVLAGCSNTIDGNPTLAPPLRDTPGVSQPSDAPPLPLPNLTDGDLFIEAYLKTLQERGITLDRDAAMQAARTACQLPMFQATREIARNTGLNTGDAAYLVGAALLTCSSLGGQQ